MKTIRRKTIRNTIISMLTGASISMSVAYADVVLTPNTINGTVSFNNSASWGSILPIAASAVMTGCRISASSTSQPNLSATTDCPSAPPVNPLTGMNYSLTVESDGGTPPGNNFVTYQVSGIAFLGAFLVNQFEQYNYEPKHGVTVTPTSPGIADFADWCVVSLVFRLLVKDHLLRLMV